MTDVTPVLSRADQNLGSSLDRLFELLRIKSISTDPGVQSRVPHGCRMAGRLSEDTGFRSFRSRYARPPDGRCASCRRQRRCAACAVLRPLRRSAGRSNRACGKTIPSNQPIKDVGNGRKILTGRGTADDKGQLMTFVEACRAYKEVNGALPCRDHYPFRGRRGIRLAVAQALSGGKCGRTEGRLCACLRYRHVGPRDPGDLLLPCAALSVKKSSLRRPTAICIPGFSAARQPIRSMSSTTALAGLHDETGRITTREFL